jgi:hypothetical protein
MGIELFTILSRNLPWTISVIDCGERDGRLKSSEQTGSTGWT